MGWLPLIRSRGYSLRYVKTDLGRIFEGKYAGKHFDRPRNSPHHSAVQKPSPRGEGAPVRTLGRMRGRPCTQPFLVEVEKGGSRLSPQRTFSPAPLGNPVAPSSVTFGDSFPPRGSLWVVQPYTKKRSKSGHVHGYRNSPSTGTMRHNRQNERARASGP